MNNLTVHGVSIYITAIKHNHKLINSFGKGWGKVKSCLQSNGSLNMLTLFQLFDELRGLESNSTQTLKEISGGTDALVSSTTYIPPISVMTEPHS